MKWNKEILAIITSLLLLAALVINWGYNVYQNKLLALKAESNIIFFDALETAKERMFLRRTIRPILVTDDDDKYRWMDMTHHSDSRPSGLQANRLGPSYFSQDSSKPNSIKYRIPRDSLIIEIITGELSNNLSSNIFEHLSADGTIVQWINDTDLPNHKHENNTLQIKTETEHIHRVMDTIIVVDFDTTQSYLETVFVQKMDTANLHQLNIKVYDLEDLESQEINTEFVTNPGKLGDFYFGRKSYAAMIQNFGPIALKKMIPEILFGLFLYGLIAAAFIIIYRSLSSQRKLVRIKDEFVGNITHELKTPISVVNVAIEAIQSFDADKDPEKVKRYLDISRKELNRLSGLVDKVLHLSINPSDDAPIERVDITDVTTQVVDAMQIRLNDSPIAIQLYAPDESLLLKANISQIKSVIYNLIDNAIKYSDIGNIKISIEKNKKEIQLKISDQGIGISKTYQDRIFDQFFRVPSDNVHNVKGYGLGLHNVKQIVEQYDGTITLISEKGVGTEFIIKWPIAHG